MSPCWNGKNPVVSLIASNRLRLWSSLTENWSSKFPKSSTQRLTSDDVLVNFCTWCNGQATKGPTKKLRGFLPRNSLTRRNWSRTSMPRIRINPDLTPDLADSTPDLAHASANPQNT